MDPNREVNEAAQGNPLATKVYDAFHGAIEDAKAKVGTGVLFDLHGMVSSFSVESFLTYLWLAVSQSRPVGNWLRVTIKQTG